ncbi:MAG TPA: sugar kinase [Flavitalea sp.]|nr:sugar kinase [Flavitalea sp.]
MSKQFDVIVVGELNVDLIMDQMTALPQEGKEILADDMTFVIGSSSAICACNLSRLGSRVAFIGKTGEDLLGDFILRELQLRNVDTSMVKQEAGLKTGATVVLNYGEDRANITHQGAMSFLSSSDIAIEKFSEAKHLHFSSFFLQPQLQQSIGNIFHAAKDAGMTTSFDAQWDPYEKWQINLQEILPHVDLFFPNEAELLKITGTTSLEQAINSVKNLVKVMVVKRGARGSLLYTNQQIKELPAFLNKSVVDAIGAGDSFNAGFIHKFIRNEPVEVCQEFGNLTAAISTQAAGGTAAFNDFENRLKNAIEQYGIITA